MNCKNCKNILTGKEKFCAQCGKAIKAYEEKTETKSMIRQVEKTKKYRLGCSSMRGNFIACNDMLYFINEQDLYQVNARNPKDFRILYSSKLCEIKSLNYYNGKLYFLDIDTDAGKCYLISVEPSKGKVTIVDVSEHGADTSFMMSENGKGYYFDSSGKYFVTVNFEDGQISAQKMPEIQCSNSQEKEGRFLGPYIHQGYAYCSLREGGYTIIKFPVLDVNSYSRMDENCFIYDYFEISPVHIYENKLFVGNWISMDFSIAAVDSMQIIQELDIQRGYFTVYDKFLFFRSSKNLLNMKTMKIYKLNQDYSANDVAFMDGYAYLFRVDFRKTILKIPLSKLFKLDIKRNEDLEDLIIFSL